MIERKDIDTLAELSRLEIAEDEKVSLQKDLEGILAYVSDLKKVTANLAGETSVAENDTALVRNAMREDTNPYESGAFSSELLAEMPETKDGYNKVKKIL